MNSGLEGRNNVVEKTLLRVWNGCLNEVRPGRPEQYDLIEAHMRSMTEVSMKSGLEGRNNEAYTGRYFSSTVESQ